MTDEERIARLRKQHSAGRASHLSKADRLDIADRIEELVKEVEWRIEPEQVENLVKMADPIMSQLYAVEYLCRQEAEAKLTKTVEALREIAAEASVLVHTKKHGGISNKKMYMAWRALAVKRIDRARAVLAELEGEE